MKIKVVVIVHDRVENIKLWLNCWKQCDQHGAELIVIQNECGNNLVEKACAAHQVKFISRKNIGFDIGAFQDVCRERLPGFDNDWDVLLWCTDDTFPMSKDFLAPFLKKIETAGVVCMDLSPFKKTHIRTTGFAIWKEHATQLQFPCDPVVTKNDCYQFEHLSKDAFYEQVKKRKLRVEQVATREKSPLWDSGYKRGLRRGPEIFKVFDGEVIEAAPEKEKIKPLEKEKTPHPNPLPGGEGEVTPPKVAFICPCYNSYPQIISSVISQTHQNWELFLLHDGPNNTGIQKYITDERIKYREMPEHKGKWGHYIRQWALQNIDELCPDADYIVITNADNYHVPVYTEYMLKGFEKNPRAIATYCSDMVHNYKAWKIIPCRLQLGYIDCAGVMIKKEAAKETGWNDIESHSSDWTFFHDIIKKYGADKWVKISGCLLIHN